MDVSINDKNNIPRIIKNLGNGLTLELGIFGENANKVASGSAITIGGLAEVHEYGVSIKVTESMRNYLHTQGIHLKKGTTHINIPERSFIRGGWNEHGKEIVEKLENLFLQAFHRGVNFNKLADEIGLEAKGKIHKYALDLNKPPNSSGTIEQKGSSNPLVDTGRMVRAIDYNITRKR